MCCKSSPVYANTPKSQIRHFLNAMPEGGDLIGTGIIFGGEHFKKDQRAHSFFIHLHCKSIPHLSCKI